MAFSWNSTPSRKPNDNNNANNNNNASSFGSSPWGNNNNNNSSNSNSNSNSGWGSTNNGSSFGANTTQTEGSSAWGNSNNSNNSNSNNNNASSFGAFGGGNPSNGGWGGGNNSNNGPPPANNGPIGGALPNPNNDHIVGDSPSDAISSARFHPNQARFIVGCWDNSISMHEFFGGNQSKKMGQQTHDRPVLDCCFAEGGDSVLSAGCDAMVKLWKPQQNHFAQIGSHQAPVRCVAYCNEQNIAISGSWDKTVAIWDPRAASGGNAAKPVFSQNVGSKVYAMAQKAHVLVVATSDTDIQTFDLRQNAQRIHSIKEEEATNKNIKAVNLKKQIRCIDIFPDGAGFVAASIGGRVIIKHFNRAIASKDFSYKCHRHSGGGGSPFQHVFAVNVLRFHPPSGVFATAGDDGEIVTWDMKGRSKLHNFKALRIPNYQAPAGCTNHGEKVDASRMPIVALDYHQNGHYMLYATSYNWNKGEQFHDKTQQKPAVYLHQTQQCEFAIKKK